MKEFIRNQDKNHKTGRNSILMDKAHNTLLAGKGRHAQISGTRFYQPVFPKAPIMETRLRTLLKACSWQLLGLLTTGLLAYALTGSFAEAGGFAMVTAGTGLLCYILHERLWLAVRWGRQ